MVFFKFRNLRNVRIVVFTGITVVLWSTILSAQTKPEKIKEEMEEIDQAQALQDSLLHPKAQKGFVPVPIIITKPALGGIEEDWLWDTCIPIGIV